jgi:hypothetical protein
VCPTLHAPGKDSQGQAGSQADGAQVNGLQTEELGQLREEVEELRRQQATLHSQLGEKETLISTLVGTPPARRNRAPPW